MRTDPIGDCFSRIRNGAKARIENVEIPYSRMKEELLNLLKREGYLTQVAVVESGAKKLKTLSVRIKYAGEGGKSVLEQIRRISKPGHRVYSRTPQGSKVRGGMGFQILSTSKGVLTDKQAVDKKVGGELLGEVY